MEKNYQAIVIGGGHAGVEASLALARTNIKTLLITLTKEGVAFCPCNPSIGGTAKGHLVCEIDALGGQMGISADVNSLQLRMLNLGKGPAVHSLRAQIDKFSYRDYMVSILESQENLDIVESEASEICAENGKVKCVKTIDGDVFLTDTVVITTGVYLNSRIIIGEEIENAGPCGFSNASHLTQSLLSLGFDIRRFKTGTPPRLVGNTIDYSKFEKQYGDDTLQTFSFMTKVKPENTHVCYLGYTSSKTKEIVMNNLDRAPMYSGTIIGQGPRYCPSIETKFVRFADKDRHQLFLEPETRDVSEIYVQGLSTSMPKDIQDQMVASVDGLENAEIKKYGYAIEYDCIDPLNLYPTLEFKKIKGIYCAGQINGTSGYEEAAAQGLLAGLNASLSIRGEDPIILTRDSSYIGVLVDDLTTKGTNEPYRMMTSRAEYRLLLRQDNADLRLTEIGRNAGLVTDERWQNFLHKKQEMEEIESKLSTIIKPSEKLANYLESIGESPAPQGISIAGLMKRNHVDFIDAREKLSLLPNYSKQAIYEVSINTKFEGYLQREKQLIKRSKKLEEKTIPEGFDFLSVKGLRLEAAEKLNQIKPLTVGAASRISGVNPADITVLLLQL